jgi:antitoxin (DNA-binding transcriptional repressor) of toxin-antitoxin stability system
MKHATIREIKHETSRVMSMVESGQSVEIRRRSKPIAILSPVVSQQAPAMPDFMARLRDIYGDQVLETTHTDLISEARGER